MARRKRHSLLVVDDDLLLRKALACRLAQGSVTVHQACDADEALDLLESYRDIDLICTDIDMPGSMDGLALIKEVHHRWPPMMIVVASGRRDIAVNDIPEGGHVISKSEGLVKIARVAKSLMQ